MTYVPTGIEALDKFLNGGLFPGTTILLLSPSGSGSEIFAKQFAAGTPNKNVTYVTTDESQEEVVQTANQMNWNFTKVKVIDLQARSAERVTRSEMSAQFEYTPGRNLRKFDPRELLENSNSKDFVRSRSEIPTELDRDGNGIPDLEEDLRVLLTPFEELSPGRMVVDNLDYFLNQYNMDVVLSTLHAAKAGHSKGRELMLWVLSKDAQPPHVERRLELMSDCVIELEVTRRGTTFERFFLIRKVRNRFDAVGVSTFAIGPNGFELETLERIV